MNMSLDNYDGLADPRKNVQNMRCSLKLIIQDHDSMCKIFPSTFRGSARAWYNNLEPNSIEGFNDLCEKLVACFSTSIPAKRTSIELFGVAQQEGESTRTYLRRFNVEMLKVEELIESVALIRGVREMPSVESFMFSTNRSFPKVNQFMKNHIRVEEVSFLQHGPRYLYKDNQRQ
jgi:hypothetical protein